MSWLDAHPFAPGSRALLVLKAEGQGEPKLGPGYAGRLPGTPAFEGEKVAAQRESEPEG